MKFTLPVVCLALSIPSAVVAAAASSGRLQGGGAGSIQAEKATAAEAAAAKAVRSLETKLVAHAASRGLRSAGVSASTKAAFFDDVVSKGRRLEGCTNPTQVGSVEPYNTDARPFDGNVDETMHDAGSIVGDKYDFVGYSYEGMTSVINMSEDGKTLIATAKLNTDYYNVAEDGGKWHDLEGALKVYKLGSDGTTWELIKQFDGQVERAMLGYANAISADGNTIAFTDEFKSASTGYKGIVHVWRFDGVDTWRELGSGLHYDQPQNNDFFGRKISMSADGDTVAIMGKLWDYRSGEVTIWKYDADTNSWAQKGGTLNQGPSRTWIGYDISLSANGERIILGNRAFDEPNFSDKLGGFASVYQYDGIDGDADNIDGWTQLGSDIRPSATEDYSARFGEMVDMSADGTKIVVCDPVSDQFFTYKLSDSGTDWTDNAKVTRASQGVYYVAMSNGGNRIIVGGPPGWGLYDFNGNLEYEGNNMNTRNGVTISGDGKSVTVTDGTYYDDGRYGRDGRGAIFVYDLGDTCPADYGSMGALASPSASGGGTATSAGTGDASSYVGEAQTLDEATTAAAEAADTVTTFFTARSAYEVASHDLEIATTQLEDATTDHAEAQAKTVALTKKHEQAVAYEATMKKAFDDATARADAGDATAAERYRLPIEAEIAYNEATAVVVEAEKAKDAAVVEEQAALVAKNSASATKAAATAAEAAAKTALDAELAEVNANLLIPKINPTTLDFPYVDTDGDLIPNDFDACPTQMGLRRNTNDRTSSNNPGPQDFCPSGCPETGADGTTILDSDGDGIPDCEDRCPFEAGIKYNHDWTFDTKDDFSSLARNLDYHGCPDRDGDGIPDKFDACPTQAGGKCYSGCPDKGIDPVTQEPYDGDMDGVSDCDDRCPGFYGPGSSGGCPDGDFDGTPDYRDYCPSNPGTAVFAYERKLEGNSQKYMNILGCPDEDGDLVTDQADICDAPAYPNQDVDTFTGLTRVAVVNNKGCPLDSDQDGVYDGIDNCDGTVHSANPVHDPRAVVFSPTDDGFSAADDESKLGCPKDTDNDGVADGIDQCPTEGGYIGRDGCPIDSDNDGVKDCISTQAPASYTWPFQPTACHSTSAKPDAACCTVEQDMCADTVRGAKVYAEQYTNEKLDAPVDPGCPFDTDKDGVVDGVDLCPYTTDVEIALAASNPNKVSIDASGCATMSAPMWESTFVDVTTGSEGANPKVEMLFTVDALLPQVATTRGYNVANELVAVQIMDASCTNVFDASNDELLPATITVNNAGLFTGQTPTGSIPITIDVNLNPDNVVGSEVWTTEPPFDVGSIDFCLGFSVLSDTKKSVTYKELKTTILIDMTQDFAVTDISVERNEAEETTKLIDIEYPLAACQCTTDNTCVEDSDLDDSFLSQSDSLKLCVRFAPDADNNDELPPDYVQMTDVKSFTCNQGGLSISPIVNFERQGDGGQLTSVETINNALSNGESYTKDDRMLIVNTRLPATFFGAEERPVDCVGTIVYEFAAGSVIDPSLVGTDRQRLLSEASVPLTSGQTSRRDAEEAPEAEAESEFSVEVMLAKAAAGRSVGVIAGAAVASALVVASGAAVTTMAIRRPGSGGVPKFSSGQPSTQQQSWTETSASTQEEGRAFTITNGAVA